MRKDENRHRQDMNAHYIGAMSQTTSYQLGDYRSGIRQFDENLNLGYHAYFKLNRQSSVSKSPIMMELKHTSSSPIQGLARSVPCPVESRS